MPSLSSIRQHAISSELTDEQAATYLAGEALPTAAPSGWTLATWYAPARLEQNNRRNAQNHLPKGQRKRN